LACELPGLEAEPCRTRQALANPCGVSWLGALARPRRGYTRAMQPSTCTACRKLVPPGKERCVHCDAPLPDRLLVEVDWSAEHPDEVRGEGTVSVVAPRGTSEDGVRDLARAAFLGSVDGCVHEVREHARVARRMRRVLKVLLPAAYSLQGCELSVFRAPAGDGSLGPDQQPAEHDPVFKWVAGEPPTLHMGALTVVALREALEERQATGQPWTLRGPHKQLELVRAANTASPQVEGDTLRVTLTPDQVASAGRELKPRCGDYQLGGLSLQVVESRLRDARGHVVRVVGWDALPGAESGQPGAASGRGSWRRRLVWLIALAALAPVGLVMAAVGMFRHVPYQVPAEWTFQTPSERPADQDGGLTVRYLGISGYEVSDGETTLLLDPQLTRPTVLGLWQGPLTPDEALLEACPKADFILVNHGHYDHALDAPALALRTGATVVGTQSSINLALARGVPPGQTLLAQPGQRLVLGTFTIDVRPSRHPAILGMPEPMPGVIPPDAGPLWWWQFTQDGALCYRLLAAGTSLWFHPTPTHEGELNGLPARNLIMGVNGEPLTPGLAAEVLGEVRPRRVIPTHFDNFLQPRGRGLALMPELDLGAARDCVRGADPDVEWIVLDYDQTIWLPPDPVE
jgi:L-ascorbate metabolism protein UlaG (beta-lactamase superfamily)